MARKQQGKRVRGATYAKACDAAGIPPDQRFPQSSRFPQDARYGPLNHPDLSDETVIAMIGFEIGRFLKHPGGVWRGVTWEQRFPAFRGYLTARGLAPEDAVSAHERWKRDEEAASQNSKRLGTANLLPGGGKVEILKRRPSVVEVLAGIGNWADAITPDWPSAGEPSSNPQTPGWTEYHTPAEWRTAWNNCTESTWRKYRDEMKADKHPVSRARRVRFKLADLQRLGLAEPP